MNVKAHVTLTLPVPVLREADKRAKRAKMTRSEYVALVLFQAALPNPAGALNAPSRDIDQSLLGDV